MNLIIEVVFLTVFWAWVVSAALFLRTTLVPRLPPAATPEQFHLPYATVRFSSTDGVPLEGWEIPTDPSRPWLILCHGLGSNRADLLEVAAGLHRLGWNLFLFDFRAHGGSAGRVTSFGWREQRDLEGALAFLGAQPDIAPRPYGVYGISMGAAVALMVASRDDRIGAVIADSPYETLHQAIAQHVRSAYPRPFLAPILWFTSATYRLRFGRWPSQLSPQDSLRAIEPRSVLLIYGTADPRMSQHWVGSLARETLSHVRLWPVHGADHLEAYGLDPERYLREVGMFLDDVG